MKILLWSYSFHPHLGGIETMTDILARELSVRGHEVTVVTRTVARVNSSAEHPFTVVRNPSWYKLTRLVADCDVCVHNHLSLKAAMPLILFPRPWLVVYHTWYPTSGLRGWLRPIISSVAVNVACSKAVANNTGPQCLIIPNAYDDGIFRNVAGSVRERELVFVGRLIKDKGVHLLLDALALLRVEGLCPRLTVVGKGSERAGLIHKTQELGLTDQVSFVGAKMGDALAEVLNRHNILVVPSLWPEPFGIVALEGLACGCVVVGSEGGGLKEAIGPGGVTFPNSNVPALAKCLAQLLRFPESWPGYVQSAADHLSKHTRSAVVSAYLEAIEQTRGRRSPREGVCKAVATVGVEKTSRALPMKILLWTSSFEPNIGGIETMARILAREFNAAGHQVTVVTRTAAIPGETEEGPFKVVRMPSWLQLLRLVADCDVFMHNHLSLKVAFPLLLFRRPWLVVYHCAYPTSGIRAWLQPLALRFALNIACSKDLAESTGLRCRVLLNAYDDQVFRELPHSPRNGELIFVGRLIVQKGVQVLLEALALLRAEGFRPRLTVVGVGPDLDQILTKTIELELTDQVEFIGKKTGQELADVLNGHRILVIPSLIRESFGIVALEAIACGCVVVGSDYGGLKDAIGPCGVTFPLGNARALAEVLLRLLLFPETWREYRQSAADHLRKHTALAVAGTYLDTIKELTAPRSKSRDPEPHAQPLGESPDLSSVRPICRRESAVFSESGIRDVQDK